MTLFQDIARIVYSAARLEGPQHVSRRPDRYPKRQLVNVGIRMSCGAAGRRGASHGDLPSLNQTNANFGPIILFSLDTIEGGVVPTDFDRELQRSACQLRLIGGMSRWRYFPSQP